MSFRSKKEIMDCKSYLNILDEFGSEYYDFEDGLTPFSYDILIEESEEFSNALTVDMQVESSYLLSNSEKPNRSSSSYDPEAASVSSSKNDGYSHIKAQEDDICPVTTFEPVSDVTKQVLDLPQITRIKPDQAFFQDDDNLLIKAPLNQVQGLVPKKRKIRSEQTTVEIATDIMSKSGLSHEESNFYMTFYYNYHFFENDVEKQTEVLERAFSCGIKLTEKANLKIFNIGSQRYRRIISNTSGPGKKLRKNHHFEHGVKKQLGSECHNSFMSFMLRWPLRDDNYFADENIVSIQYLFNLYSAYCSDHKKNDCIISYSSFRRLRKKYFSDAVFHGRINCCERQKKLRST